MKPLTIHPLAPRPNVAADGAGSGRPAVVVVSHVPPWPATAGNELRLARLIRWLDQVGYAVHFVYRPFADRPANEQHLNDLRARYPRLYVYGAEQATVRFVTDDPSAYDAVTALAGWGKPVYERMFAADRRHLEQRAFDLTSSFAPDGLIELVARTVDAVKPVAVIAQYVFMSRLIRAMPRSTLRMLDLIDLFSAKEDKVVRFGVDDAHAISGREEAFLLDGADAVIAIQDEEAAAVRKLASNLQVITAGIDFPVIPKRCWPADRRVAVIGSDNALNLAGLAAFMRLAWPTILRDVRDAQLVVVGSIARALSGAEPNVVILGRQDDLAPVYASARVCINPAFAGTGIKVKTLEAIANRCPIVLWPSGADGLTAAIRSYCSVANDWSAFAHLVIGHLQTSPEPKADGEQELRRLLSADVTYSQLHRLLSASPAFVG